MSLFHPGFKRWVLPAILGALATVAALVLAPGASATVSQEASSSVAAGTVITTPSGTKVTLVKDLGQYSVAELTAIGLGPGQHAGASNGVAVATGAGSPIVQPNSATGTNGDVTIYLKGKGLKVDSWETSLNDSFGGGYTYAAFWRPSNVVWATSDVIYVPPDSYAFAYIEDTPIYFGGTTKVCNTWVHYAGKPCETVHS